MSAPTARRILDLLELNAPKGSPQSVLATRVEAVIALHKHRPNTTWPTLVGHCDHCVTYWPCATVRLLDGEQPTLAPSPFSGEPGTSSAAGGSWGPSGGGEQP